MLLVFYEHNVEFTVSKQEWISIYRQFPENRKENANSRAERELNTALENGNLEWYHYTKCTLGYDFSLSEHYFDFAFNKPE